MSLSGEVCPARRRLVVSSRYQPDHWFTKSRRIAVLPRDASESGSETNDERSAARSDPRRDRPEVSRGHSSHGILEGVAVKGRT
jgi:hypothetical protein